MPRAARRPPTVVVLDLPGNSPRVREARSRLPAAPRPYLAAAPAARAGCRASPRRSGRGRARRGARDRPPKQGARIILVESLRASAPADLPARARRPAREPRTRQPTDSASSRRATKPRTWARRRRATERHRRAQQRPLLGDLGQQAERSQRDAGNGRAGPRTRGRTRRAVRPAGVREARRAARASGRTADAVPRTAAPSPPRRPRSGRLGTRRPAEPHTAAMPSCRPRLTPYDQDRAVAAADILEQPVQRLALPGPAPERRQALDGHFAKA